MPGRSTFTATSRPSVVTAKCTWAIEAAATGTSSKLREQRVDRLAELALDDAPGLGAGKGRQMVLQPREVGGDLFAQQIGAGRQRLAELDEGRPHLLQRRRQPLARPARVAAAGEQPRPGDQRRRDAQRLERKQRIVAREAQRHAQQAPAVAKGTRSI